MRDILDDAASGTSRIVLIGGEIGIGKTRITEELVAGAPAAGARPAWGNCHDDQATPPLWPWVQILRSLGVTSMPLPEHERGVLATLLPELGEPGPVVLDVDAARFRLFDTVRHAIERAAAAKPLLVVIEDVHWADITSLRLLKFLAVELRNSPVLIVATHRDPDPDSTPTSPALADLLAQPRTERLLLTGLSPAEVAQLIRQDSDTPTADGVLAAEIHRRTDGNPFFVTELARLLRSERGPAAATVAGDIPVAVGDVIRRRIGRLPDDVQIVLGVASVIGAQLDVDVLRRACGLDEETTLDVLEVALVARILVGPDGGPYRFAHTLVAETIYADLNPVRRSRLHARVAEAIEATFVDDLEPRVAELANHYGRARRGAPAVDYAIRAAQQAEQRMAFDDATTHWRAAVAALELDGAPDADRLTRLLLDTAAAIRRAGDQAGGLAVNDTALAAAERSGNIALLAEAALAYGEIGLWQVRPYGIIDERVVAAMTRALDALDTADTPLRARLLVGLAVALYYDESARERGEQFAHQAVTMARRIGDQRLLAETLVELVVMLDASPDLPRQLALADELSDLQGRDIPVAVGTTARMRLARLRLANADTTHLRGDIEQVSAEADHDRQPLIQMWATWARTTVAFLDGRLDEAASHAETAFERHQQLGIWGATETYGLHMMLIWREQGRMAEMAPFVEPILRETLHPSAPKMLGIFAIERGATHEIPAILGPDPIPHLHDFTWLADVCVTAELAAAAHLPCAAQLYETLLPYGERIVTMDGTFLCLGSARRYLGLLAASLGRIPDAIAHLERAVQIDDQANAIPSATRSRWHLANIVRDSDPRRANDLLATAHQTATQHRLASLTTLTQNAMNVP